MADTGFLPVLLGSDINAYSMARTFHEEYGVCSVMISKTRTDITAKGMSKIIYFKEEPALDDNDNFLAVMNRTMQEYGKNRRLILIACSDEYVRLIVDNRDLILNIGYVVPYATKSVVDRIVLKDNLCSVCDKYGIEYPSTYIYKPWMNFEISYDFPYPLVVKPCDTVDYHRHAYVGQHKVYYVYDKKELIDTLRIVYGSGYSGNMIIQDMVPGDDSFEYDLQMYVGEDHQAKLINLGNVLLQEHDPSLRGNNAATLTVFNEGLMLSIAHVLEAIGFEGFADADIKLDPRDGKYKLLEINARQGRSHYRVSGAGENLARYLVDDRINHKKMPKVLVDEPFFWTVVPTATVYSMVDDREKLKAARKLVAEGRFCNSIRYEDDMPLRRRIMLFRKSFVYYINFLKYYFSK